MYKTPALFILLNMYIFIKGGVYLGNINYIKETLFEHQFWLQILGDHGKFIYNALAPSEKEKIEHVDYFIHIFDELLEQARKQLSDEQIYELTKIAFSYAEEIRKFKLQIIKEHLVGNIKIELSPTFINHMVNEVEEYLRILHSLLKFEIPTEHPLHYHRLWLPDASGHAGAIQCGLDPVEKDIRIKSKEFMKDFDDLYMKADEFKGYTRTGLMEFPTLTRLNHQAEFKIGMFMRFLKETEDLRLCKKAVGTLAPLLTDHMYREACYYLLKLSRVAEIKTPNCDPTTPRICC